MKYSVLLLYPDYLADAYGQETYLAWVKADDVKKAQRKAQVEALRAQPYKEGIRADDFFVLFVAEGHLKNLKSWKLEKYQ